MDKTSTFLTINQDDWLRLPFWRVPPVGYFDPHASARGWRLKVYRWGVLLAGHNDFPIAGFRWRGKWTGGRRTFWGPLKGLGLRRWYLPIWEYHRAMTGAA